MNFSSKSDIFALGVIWFEMLCGKTPFEAGTEKELKIKTKDNHVRKVHLGCSDRARDVIMRCLRYKKDERPVLSELKIVIEEELQGNERKRAITAVVK